MGWCGRRWSHSRVVIKCDRSSQLFLFCPLSQIITHQNLLAIKPHFCLRKTPQQPSTHPTNVLALKAVGRESTHLRRGIAAGINAVHAHELSMCNSNEPTHHTHMKNPGGVIISVGSCWVKAPYDGTREGGLPTQQPRAQEDISPILSCCATPDEVS